jgi:hypothetical protein
LKHARKSALLAIVIAAVYGFAEKNPQILERLGIDDREHLATTQPGEVSGRLQRAIEYRQSGIQVRGEGTVIRLLRDDNEGSRHQKFILRLPSGDSLLVAHNIDLAPRINGLERGDTVAFHGEYEWNERGGVVHWTHHDPKGRHVGGWLKHEGRTYQ